MRHRLLASMGEWVSDLGRHGHAIAAPCAPRETSELAYEGEIDVDFLYLVERDLSHLTLDGRDLGALLVTLAGAEREDGMLPDCTLQVRLRIEVLDD